MLRKITGFLICLSIVLTNIYVFADNNADDAEYKARIEKLTYLGMRFNEDISKDTKVTRANFIRNLLQTVNVKPYCNDRTFYDVDEDHTYFEDISTGAQKGYMIGFEDGNFYPDKVISVNDSVKALVNALGYEAYAMNNGGYPNGYLMTARNIGLLDGVNVKNAELDYNTFTLLLENFLDCNIYEMKYDGSSLSYDINNDNNALSEFHNIVKKKATVTANSVTGLDSCEAHTVNREYVKLNGEEVLVGDTDIADYLGYSVEAYIYYDDDGDEGIVKFFKPDRKNSTVTVDSENIYGDLKGFSAYNFIYETESGKIKNVSIDDKTSVIYNGVAKNEYSKEDLIPEIGSVKLIDNNNDGNVECISIFKAEKVIIVEYASVKDDGISISDKKDQSVSYFYDKEYEDYTVYLDGEKSVPEAIKAGMLVLIGTNGEHSITYAYSETVSGKITKVNDDKIMIDGEEYKLAIGSERYVFNLNEKGKFWVDDKNDLFGFEKDKSGDGIYGYFIKGFFDDNEDPVVAGIRVLNSDNDFVRYDLAEYVKVNGRRTENTIAMNVLRENGIPNEAWQPQLIMYKLNDEEKITELNTVTEKGELQYSGKFFNYPLATFKSKYAAVYGNDVEEFSYVNKDKNEYLANNGEYNYYGSSWRNIFWQDADTIWFNIYDSDPESSYVGGRFTEEKHTNYELEFYNITEDKNTADVIIYRKEGAASLDTQNCSTSYNCTPAIVTDVSETLNDDNEIVLTITVNNQGKTVFLEYYDKMPEPTKIEFNACKPGDIIYYEFDTAGRITFLYRAFDIDRYDELGFSGKTGLVHGNTGLNQTSRESLYVTVQKKLANNFFTYISQGDRSGYIKKVLDGSTCYRMTVKGNKVTVENITWDDVQNGENVFVYSRYAQCKSVIAIDKK